MSSRVGDYVGSIKLVVYRFSTNVIKQKKTESASSGQAEGRLNSTKTKTELSQADDT